MTLVKSSLVLIGSMFLMSPSFAATPVCDLEQDKCAGTPPTQAEVDKAVFLSDLVGEKLLQIEAREKAAGRDFKVALISRMGSDLTHFQPLIETDKNGKLESTQQIIDDLRRASRVVGVNGGHNMGSQQATAANVLQGRLDKNRTLKYSHMGIALKNAVIKGEKGNTLTDPKKGKWAVYQLLYSCRENHESYVHGSTIDFFYVDHMYDYGSEIIVPEQSLQENIEDLLVDDKGSDKFLQTHYNAAALPNDLTQQNSNQWVLEAVAGALAPKGSVTNRAQAQQFLADTDYYGTRLTPTGLYKLIETKFAQKILGELMPTMCMSAQPSIASDHIGEIVTTLSVNEYLKRQGKVTSVEEVALTEEEKDSLDALDIEAATKAKKQSSIPGFLQPNN